MVKNTKKIIIICVTLWLIISLTVCTLYFNYKDNNKELEKQVEIDKRIELCSTNIGITYYRDQCNEFGECYKQYIDCDLKLYNPVTEEDEYGQWVNK